jgi:hypothetical protein
MSAAFLGRVVPRLRGLQRAPRVRREQRQPWQGPEPSGRLTCRWAEAEMPRVGSAGNSGPDAPCRFPGTVGRCPMERRPSKEKPILQERLSAQPPPWGQTSAQGPDSLEQVSSMEGDRREAAEPDSLRAQRLSSLLQRALLPPGGRPTACCHRQPEELAAWDRLFDSARPRKARASLLPWGHPKAAGWVARRPHWREPELRGRPEKPARPQAELRADPAAEPWAQAAQREPEPSVSE